MYVNYSEALSRIFFVTVFSFPFVREKRKKVSFPPFKKNSWRSDFPIYPVAPSNAIFFITMMLLNLLLIAQGNSFVRHSNTAIDHQVHDHIQPLDEVSLLYLHQPQSK